MTKTILNVEGMSCPSCITHVKQALAIEGVLAVDVELEDGQIAVDHNARVSTGRLIAALQQAGYEATPTTGRSDPSHVTGEVTRGGTGRSSCC